MNRITLIPLCMSIAACSSSNTPTRDQYDDTAQAIATTTATSGGGGDVASMSDTVTIALGTMPQGFSVMGDGHFQGARLGVNYDYMLSCKTAAGVTGACGPLTDQATVEVNWSGNLNLSSIESSVSRTGSWSITGLQSDTSTVSGSGTFSFDATLHSIFRPGATTHYSFKTSASYSAVRISTQQHQILDGSAAFDVTAHATVSGTDHDSDDSFDVHAEITFRTDHTADLVLDGSQHYSIDLTTGLVVRVTT